MKIYQLAASGHWSLNHARYTAYSTVVYRSEKEARAAMPAYFELLTTPKEKDDGMIMDRERLRIFIHILDLKNNKKEAKKKA